MIPQDSVLNLHALAPEVLMHESALVDALAEVEATINDTSIESVVSELLSRPHLLEFMISGKCNYCYHVCNLRAETQQHPLPSQTA
jgi:hypothetical protein